MKFGEEAEGMECQVVPVVLRVRVEHILVDKEAKVRRTQRA